MQNHQFILRKGIVDFLRAIPNHSSEAKDISEIIKENGELRDFFIRAGNTSRLLNSEDVYNYILLNW